MPPRGLGTRRSALNQLGCRPLSAYFLFLICFVYVCCTPPHPCGYFFFSFLRLGYTSRIVYFIFSAPLAFVFSFSPNIMINWYIRTLTCNETPSDKSVQDKGRQQPPSVPPSGNYCTCTTVRIDIR